MALVFVFFAILQLNDPDPVLWCGLYLVPALMSWIKIDRRLILSAGALYGALAIWWWNYAATGASCGEMFGKINWPDFFAHETVRESAGLGIVSVWLLVLALKTPNPTRAAEAASIS